MRRLYKLLLIILVGIIFTLIIYYTNQNNKESILALGDAISSGATAYNIDSISYNDYLKDSLHNKHKLNNYNNTFSKKNYKLSELISDIKKNKKTNDYIKQLINDATIITIAIGMDEIAKYSITDYLTKEYITNYILEYDNLVNMIRKYNKKELIIIGLYQANNIKNSDLLILNTGLKNVADKYNGVFIDISEILRDRSYYLKDDSFYFNYKAHYKLYEMINCTLFTCQSG